jgi:hypothetical protein
LVEAIIFGKHSLSISRAEVFVLSGWSSIIPLSPVRLFCVLGQGKQLLQVRYGSLSFVT